MLLGFNTIREGLEKALGVGFEGPAPLDGQIRFGRPLLAETDAPTREKSDAGRRVRVVPEDSPAAQSHLEGSLPVFLTPIRDNATPPSFYLSVRTDDSAQPGSAPSVSSAPSTTSVVNALQLLFDRYDSWERSLGGVLLEDGSATALVSATLSIMGNPVSVYDGDMNVLAVTFAPDVTAPAGWVVRGGDGSVPSEVFDLSHLDYDFAETHQEPYFDSCRVSSEYPPDTPVYIYNLYKDGVFEGTICVECINHAMTEGERELVADFAPFVRTMLKSSKRGAGGSTGAHGILTSLLAGQELTPFQTRPLRRLLGPGPMWCVVAMAPFGTYNEISANYLCSYLESAFPGIVAVPDDAGATATIGLTDEASCREKVGALAEALVGKSFTLGASLPFEDLSRMGDYALQARFALGRSDGAEGAGGDVGTGRAVFFEDVSLAYLLEHAVGDMSAASLLPCSLRRLLSHDAASQANWWQTLKVFLDCESSVTETSRKLFVHRSTLLQRLEAIQKATGVRIDDPDERLLLQICMRAYDRAGKDASE